MNVIEAVEVSRYFSVNRVQALSSMNLTVKKGEIHAVVGENGAGKSTLMKILHGIERYDSGSLKIVGETGMVSQHFRLLDELSILDNIIIGKEPTKLIFINRKKAKDKILDILKTYNFKLDISRKVHELSIGQKQLVEIIKVIYNNSDILIFDEPTATLSDPETEKLRETLQSLKKMGKTIVLISHKLMDIESISDRFTIIRKGHYVSTVTTKEVSINQISHFMSGESTYNKKTEDLNQKNISLEFKPLGIKLREGETLSFTGYGGCGLHKVEETLMNLSIDNPHIGYIPSDRLKLGVDLNSKLFINLGIPKLNDYTMGPFIQRKKLVAYGKKLIEKYNIIGESENHTGFLSGGNIQKTVLARVLESNPSVIILSSPTWGIDIKSSNFIYSEIDRYKANGGSVILLSFDLEEVVKISDRIKVLYKGKVIKTLDEESRITSKDLGRLCAGIV